MVKTAHTPETYVFAWIILVAQAYTRKASMLDFLHNCVNT